MIKIEKEIKIEKDESWEANWSDESSESSEYKDDGQGEAAAGDAAIRRGKVIQAKAKKVDTGEQRSTRAKVAQSEELKQKVHEKGRQQKAQKATTWKEKVKQAELAKEKDVLTDADKALIEEVREHKLKQNERKRLSRANLPEELKRKVLEKERKKKAMKRASGQMPKHQENAMTRTRAAWKEKVKEAQSAKEKDVLTDADKALIEEVERIKFEKNMKIYLSRAALTAEMSEEDKLKQRRRHVVGTAAKRTCETPDERKARLEKTRMQYKAKMANMTLEKLEHHRAVARKHQQARNKSVVPVPYAEWSEEKKERLRVDQRERTKRETPEQREARLARYKRNIEKKKDLKGLMEGGASREEAENLLKQIKPELFQRSARTGRPKRPEPQPYRPMPHWQGKKTGRPKKIKHEEIEEYLANKKKWEENFSVKWIHEVNNTAARSTSSRFVDLQQSSNSCSSVDDSSSQRTSSCSTSEARKDVAMASPKPMSTRISIDTGSSIDDMPLFSLDEYSAPSSPLPETESSINEVTKTVDLESETDSANNLATSGRKKVGKRKRIILKATNAALSIGQDNRKTRSSANKVAVKTRNATPESILESMKFEEDPIQNPVDFSMDFNTISPEDSSPSSPLPEMETDMNDVTEAVKMEIDIVETPDPECENKTSASRKKSKTKPKQSESTEYRCEQCSRTYKHKKFYEIHMIEIHGEPNHDIIAEGDNTSGTSSKIEIKTDHPSVTPKIKRKQIRNTEYCCEYCGKVYKCKRYYQAHVAEIHGKSNSKLFTCPMKECGKTFVSSIACRIHYRNHIDCSTSEQQKKKQKPMPICPICHVAFDKLCNLKKHTRQAHSVDYRTASESEIKHRCVYCSKEFKQKPTLDDHVRRIHLGMSDNCDLCGRNFQSAVKLWRHKVNSHGMKDLHPSEVGIQVEICPYCPEYVFRSMKAHVQKEHPEYIGNYMSTEKGGTKKKTSFAALINSKGHYCELCNKTLSKTVTSDVHMRRKHPELVVGNDDARPSCEVCGKKFWTEKSLATHILHAHVKRLQFKLDSNIKENGENEPLGCQFCSVEQDDRTMYKIHLINDHSEDLIRLVKSKVEEGKVLDNKDLDRIKGRLWREKNPWAKRHPRKTPKKQAPKVAIKEKQKCRRNLRSKVLIKNCGQKATAESMSEEDRNFLERYPNIKWGCPVVVIKLLSPSEISLLAKRIKQEMDTDI